MFNWLHKNQNVGCNEYCFSPLIPMIPQCFLDLGLGPGSQMGSHRQQQRPRHVLTDSFRLHTNNYKPHSSVVDTLPTPEAQAYCTTTGLERTVHTAN